MTLFKDCEYFQQHLYVNSPRVQQFLKWNFVFSSDWHFYRHVWRFLKFLMHLMNQSLMLRSEEADLIMIAFKLSFALRSFRFCCDTKSTDCSFAWNRVKTFSISRANGTCYCFENWNQTTPRDELNSCCRSFSDFITWSSQARKKCNFEYAREPLFGLNYFIFFSTPNVENGNRNRPSMNYSNNIGEFCGQRQVSEVRGKA